MAHPARTAVRLLSGYLCGTHSGVRALRRSGRSLRGGQSEAVAAAHRAIGRAPVGTPCTLGGSLWTPVEQAALAERLRRALRHPSVIDLVFYGSQVRGGRTGFSDVDALLVICDDAADDARRLRALRRRVLAAQRAVLAFQPMQHHGFEVATPRLLRAAGSALSLPATALEETSSLAGVGIEANLDTETRGSYEAFRALLRSVDAPQSWPRHPWSVHRLVSMFELLPALYLQSRGTPTTKSASFDRARAQFGDAWWPYDVLERVRLAWPRESYPIFDACLLSLRNPWLAVAIWRRLPARVAATVQPMITPSLLDGLKHIGRTMATRIE